MGSSAGSFNCSIGWHLALLSDRGGVPNKERQGSMHLKPRTAGWAAVTVLALFLVGLTGFWAFDFGQRRQLEVREKKKKEKKKKKKKKEKKKKKKKKKKK